MTQLTSDLLQELSVRCASRYMAKQASLNEAIADEGRAMELNSDQLQRVIETTNTVAYLRQLQDAPDRTFEFPVADYPGVMLKMAMPADLFNKEAEEKVSTITQVPVQTSSPATPEFSQQEKVAMLSKELLKCAAVMDDILHEKARLTHTLLTKSASLNKSDFVLEKLAYVVDEEDFSPMANLLGLEKTASLCKDLVFTDKELDEVTSLYGHYKEAKALIQKEKSTEEFVKRAGSILNSAIGGIGSVIGRGIGKGVGAVGKGIHTSTIGVGSSFGFGDQVLRKGFVSSKGKPNINAGIKEFDKIKRKSGEAAAVAHFGGKTPNLLAHRLNGPIKLVGKMGMGALGVEHAHDVWKELN
jgi:hypothetical protein